MPDFAFAEFKEMVARFHDAGIEVILDVVYNHTAEGSLKRTRFAESGRSRQGHNSYRCFRAYVQLSGKLLMCFVHHQPAEGDDKMTQQSRRVRMPRRQSRG